MPLTIADIQRAVRDAEEIVNAELPLRATDPGTPRDERRAFRAIAFTEVLRTLLGQAETAWSPN